MSFGGSERARSFLAFKVETDEKESTNIVRRTFLRESRHGQSKIWLRWVKDHQKSQNSSGNSWRNQNSNANIIDLACHVYCSRSTRGFWKVQQLSLSAESVTITVKVLIFAFHYVTNHCSYGTNANDAISVRKSPCSQKYSFSNFWWHCLIKIFAPRLNQSSFS